MNSPNHLQTRLEDLDQLVAKRARELHDANEQLKKEIAERVRAESVAIVADETWNRAAIAERVSPCLT